MKRRWLAAGMTAVVGFWIFWLASAAVAGSLRVRYVIDGDTVIVQDGRHVRLIGINAPEIAHEDKAAEPYGYAARKALIELIGQRSVRLVYDIQRRDRYGRTLAYIYAGTGTSLNEQMVRAGLAHCLCIPPNRALQKRLLAAQRLAMRSRIGFWQRLDNNRGPYIGNRKSFRFHTLRCRYGRHTARKNRIRFATLYDAFYAGFSPGSRCLPGISVIAGRK